MYIDRFEAQETMPGRYPVGDLTRYARRRRRMPLYLQRGEPGDRRRQGRWWRLRPHGHDALWDYLTRRSN